jgi:hypothetical protein
MAAFFFRRWIIFVVSAALTVLVTCTPKNEEPNNDSNDIYDVDKNGIPRFVGVDYIELEKIDSISKFRSSVGHDYSDAFEHCRSMKHYFKPKNTVDWTNVKIFSPVAGKITRAEQEWAGTKLEIQSDSIPAFRFVIFHINLTVPLYVDDRVAAGQQLGTHIGSQTMSDIAVIVNDPTRQGKMVSYFDVMKDTVFQGYSNRGIVSREEMIIPKSVRDTNQLTCSGDAFVSADTLQNWVVLN